MADDLSVEMRYSFAVDGLGSIVDLLLAVVEAKGDLHAVSPERLCSLVDLVYREIKEHGTFKRA